MSDFSMGLLLGGIAGVWVGIHGGVLLVLLLLLDGEPGES